MTMTQLREALAGLGYAVAEFTAADLGRVLAKFTALVAKGTRDAEALAAAVSIETPALARPLFCGSFGAVEVACFQVDLPPRPTGSPFRPSDSPDQPWPASQTTPLRHRIATVAEAVVARPNMSDEDAELLRVTWHLSAEEFREARREAIRRGILRLKEKARTEAAAEFQTDVGTYLDQLTRRAEETRDPRDIARARETLDRMKNLFRRGS